MELSERRRLTQALGWGAGVHLLLLLILLVLPMESRQEKVTLGALKVELGPALDARAGIKASGTQAATPPAQTPRVQQQSPPQTRPAVTPSAPPSTATDSRTPVPSRQTPPTTSPSSPAASPAPVPSAAPATSPSPARVAPEPNRTASAPEVTPSQPAEVRKPSPPAPVDTGLRSSSQAAAQPQEMEGLDLLAGLSDLGRPSPGLSKAEGQTKFEAGSGNPVELETGVVNARPLPLVAPVAPDGTPPGELEVRFVIGTGGLVQITPESLVMRGLSGNIARTPVTSEEWIRLRSAVEKALSRWLFTTDGREIRGRVVFTIKAK